MLAATTLIACSLAQLPADDPSWFDALSQSMQDLGDALVAGDPDGAWTVGIDPWIDQTGWFFTQPPPGFIQADGHALYAPVVNLMGTATAGKVLDFTVYAMASRGFDPTEAPMEMILNEYFVNVRPFENQLLALRAGAFGTTFGQWNRRYLSFENPLIDAPLPYGWMTSIGDGTQLPANPAAAGQLGRKDKADNVPDWNPIIWGPAYASGFSALGTFPAWQGPLVDWAVEVKNASLSSRPEEWAWWDRNMASPTITGRVAIRPDARWTIGGSVSQGSYLIADPTVRTGTSIGDPGQYDQTTWGIDLSYAHRWAEIWAEFIWNTFDQPALGDLTSFSWFVEGRINVAVDTWVSARWNSQFYGDLNGESWDNDVQRFDIGGGTRLSESFTFKLQFSHANESGSVDQGQWYGATQLIMEF